MKLLTFAAISLILSLTVRDADTRAHSAQDPPKPGEKVRFSNIKFSLSQYVIESSTPNMVLRPQLAAIKDQAKLVISPAVPFDGTLKQGCEAAWNSLKSGKSVRGEKYESEPQNVLGGGKLMHMGSQFEPAGGGAAIVILADGKLTRMALTMETDIAYQYSAMSLGAFLMSIEVVKDQPESGGTGISGGPSSGPDAGDSFDWDGPDRMEYGIYDHDCRQLNEEYDELVDSNKQLVGSIKPRAVTYEAALNAARLVLKNPEAKTQFDFAEKYGTKENPKVYLATATTMLLDGDAFGALAQILAGVDAAPTNPTLQFNLASLLAEINMPNESLAVLKHMEATAKKPEMAAGLQPGATMDYLNGYNQMLLGKVSEASAKFKSVIAAEPFLNEASHCLALITAKQGGNGKAVLQKGLFRFPVKKTVFCVQGETDSQRPSVDSMFDCSKGVPGVLSDFRQPNGIDNYKAFVKVIMRLTDDLRKELEARKAAVTANPSPYGPTPFDKWAEKMFDLMQGLDEREPVFLKLQKDIEDSRNDFHKAADIHYARLIQRTNELALDPTPHKCPMFRDAAAQALNAMRPYVVHLELMHRRYAKTSYRILTGLLARFPKGKWRDAAEAYTRSWLTELDVQMVLDVWQCYGPINAGIAGIIHEECLADGNGTYNLPSQPNLVPCPPGLKDAGFKYSLGLPDNGTSLGPKVGAKVGCSGITFEVEFPLVKAKAPSGLIEYGAGGFAQVEMEWGGSWTVFAGAKGSISIGPAGVTEKSGIYVKGKVGEGATEMGGRVQFDAQGKAGDYTISNKMDKMDFTIIPAPTPPKLGPGLKSFKNQNNAEGWIHRLAKAAQPCCSIR